MKSKSKLNIEYYITLVLVWIILLLGMYYMYLQLSSTLFWNQKIEKLYETFTVAKKKVADTNNKNTIDSKPAPSEYSFICTFRQIEDGKGMSFGCSVPVPK
jgi:hypothetical protein